MWRANVRFDRAVAALNNEPGLVVIDAQRGWRDWKISGLRDPHARAPRTVLSAAGLSPGTLRENWEPYLSLDSAVVTARARQQWSLPSAATLALASDTATVSGELPLRSLGLIQRGSLPPGVTDVQVSSARIILPPHLDSIRAALVAARVLFAPGASETNVAEHAHARALADRFRLLDDSVWAHSGNLGIAVIGRTDPTGTDRTNQALAQWRVDHVSAIFAAAGVRPDAVGGEALATSRPLPAADSSLQARINRSVSFDVFVSTRPRAPRER